MGTDTQFTLSYLHQEEDNRPDYGLPYVFGRPAPVSLDTFYGLTDDYEDVTVDLLTAKLDHVATDWLKLSNTLRAGYYTRDATTVGAARQCARSGRRCRRSGSRAPVQAWTATR